MENGSAFPEEDNVPHNLSTAHDKNSDDGTEERRLVIVKEESKHGDKEQADEEDLENLQPLDLSVPRQDTAALGESHSNVPVHAPFQDHATITDQGPSTSWGSASAVESPPLVQGQLS